MPSWSKGVLCAACAALAPSMSWAQPYVLMGTMELAGLDGDWAAGEAALMRDADVRVREGDDGWAAVLFSEVGLEGANRLSFVGGGAAGEFGFYTAAVLLGPLSGDAQSSLSLSIAPARPAFGEMVAWPLAALSQTAYAGSFSAWAKPGSVLYLGGESTPDTSRFAMNAPGAALIVDERLDLSEARAVTLGNAGRTAQRHEVLVGPESVLAIWSSGRIEGAGRIEVDDAARLTIADELFQRLVSGAARDEVFGPDVRLVGNTVVYNDRGTQKGVFDPASGVFTVSGDRVIATGPLREAALFVDERYEKGEPMPVGLQDYWKNMRLFNVDAARALECAVALTNGDGFVRDVLRRSTGDWMRWRDLRRSAFAFDAAAFKRKPKPEAALEPEPEPAEGSDASARGKGRLIGTFVTVGAERLKGSEASGYAALRRDTQAQSVTFDVTAQWPGTWLSGVSLEYANVETTLTGVKPAELEGDEMAATLFAWRSLGSADLTLSLAWRSRQSDMTIYAGLDRILSESVSRTLYSAGAALTLPFWPGEAFLEDALRGFAVVNAAYAPAQDNDVCQHGETLFRVTSASGTALAAGAGLMTEGRLENLLPWHVGGALFWSADAGLYAMTGDRLERLSVSFPWSGRADAFRLDEDASGRVWGRMNVSIWFSQDRVRLGLEGGLLRGTDRLEGASLALRTLWLR